jgi:hypothetical protein
LDSVWQEAQTQNISEGGLFVSGNLSQDLIGDVVHLDLQLENKFLHAVCQVAWIKREQGVIIGLGLKILQIDPKNKEIYLTYIYKRISPKKKAYKIKFLRQPLFKLGDKERRCCQILDYIRRFGPVSKADICKEINLNAVSTGKFIDEFLRAGLVFDCGLDLSSGGRRAQLFKLNRDFGLILGVEVNLEKSYLLALVTNLELGNILEEKKLIDNKQDINITLSSFLTDIITKLKAKNSQILGIGIGVSNGQVPDGLENYISKALDLPVVVEEGFHLESFAQSWLVRELVNKSILYMHSRHLTSLILGGDIFKPEKEIGSKIELVPMDLVEKALALIEFLGPDIVYISKRVDKEFPEVKKVLNARLNLANIKETQAIKVLISEIDEDKIVALGAISLVMKEIFVGICR